MDVDGHPGDLEELFSGSAPDAVLPASVARQKKHEVQSFYDKINDSLSESIYADDATFFNFGYLPDGRPRSAQIQLPPHWPNRNRIDLVLELIGDCTAGAGGSRHGGRSLLDGVEAVEIRVWMARPADHRHVGCRPGQPRTKLVLDVLQNHDFGVRA